MALNAKRKQKSILDYFSNKSKDNNAVNDSWKCLKTDHNSTPVNGTKRADNACVEVLRDVSNDEFIDLNQFLEIDVAIDANSSGDQSSRDTTDSNEDNYMKSSYVYHNFRQMIDFVLNDQHFAGLFDANDMNVIQTFTCLSGLAQMLLMRLFMRKKQWIRKSAIKYPEIADNLQPILRELIDNQFLFNEKQLTDLKEAMNILDSNEIKKIGKSLNGMNMNGLHSKRNIIPAILKYIQTCQSVIKTDKQLNSVSEALLKSIRSVLKDKCFKVNESLCEPFERMFLLHCQPDINDEDLSVHYNYEFFKQMKAETGQEVYPKYTTNRKEIIYKTRDQLIRYSEAFKLEIEILSAIEKRQLDEGLDSLMSKAEQMYLETIKENEDQNDALLPPFLRRYTGGQTYIRCLSHSVSILEQKKNHSKAVSILKDILLNQSIYCSDMRGFWFERLALDLDKHLKDPKSASEVMERGLNDSCVRTGHRLALYKRQRNIQKSVKNGFTIDVEYENIKFSETTISAESFKCTVSDQKSDRKNFFKTTDSNGDVTVMSVEDIVIKHYKSNGFTDGIHSEGRIYHTILGLLFWDIIYMSDGFDVSDAFRFQYQRFPLDFNSDEFYLRRKTQIVSLLNILKNMTQTELCNVLENSWNTNFGTISMINWQMTDINQIKEIATCFGSSIITDICERLIKDFRHTRSGFPDLLVWNTNTKRIKAVEVKGPNDKPSNKQLLWLSFLQSIGADVELCHVKVKKSLHLDNA